MRGAREARETTRLHTSPQDGLAQHVSVDLEVVSKLGCTLAARREPSIALESHRTGGARLEVRRIEGGVTESLDAQTRTDQRLAATESTEMPTGSSRRH